VTGDEVRSVYLKFFAEKKHEIVPSASLIPHGDPTLLLTSAGMVQFKAYYLGEEVPSNPRLVSCQKCFRTTDVESVGDTSHLTFFEMLGNFSIGDYFKRESIRWAWEFVTERLKLAPERLWASIYLDDDESFDYWLEETGIPESRILRFGEKENFWGPAGNSGPCGPCSEIHYDFGEEIGCGKSSCAPNCGCARFSEIWNLVFTQYNQDEAGQRTPLPKPNIDTGMGLERTVAAVSGKTSVYETELFLPLLDNIAGLTGKSYGADAATNGAMRVVAEHGRGITFLIGDGVIPGNEGRGYVLRRLLRRAALFGRRLGLDKPFLTEIAGITIERMGHVYPEIKQRRDFILKAIELEETRFSGTLSAGLELLDGIVAELAERGEKEISGKQTFKLYDTYGFPAELTTEVAHERSFSVDLEGFNHEMEKQRAKARKVALFAPGKEAAREAALLARAYDTTPFVGYHNLKHQSVIIDLLVDGAPTEAVNQGQTASLILETTPFYGEMGGQVGDTGVIRRAGGKFSVADTVRIPPDIIIHQGRVTEGGFSAGDEVTAEVDGERRRDIACNHTATHLLHLALRRVLGEHVQQQGSLVASERFSFDFSHLYAMTAGELAEVPSIVNEKIRQDLPVSTEDLPYKRAIDEGAIALFGEKYGDVVRVLKVGRPPVSVELCGGTHVKATGEIGFFGILSEHSIGAGLRRIEAVTGRGAEALIRHRFASLKNIASRLNTSPDEVEAKTYEKIEALHTECRRRQDLEQELARLRAESLLGQVEMVDGVNALVAKVPATRQEILREMSDFLCDRLKSAVVVLGTVDKETGRPPSRYYQGDDPDRWPPPRPWTGRLVFLVAVTPDLVARGYDAGEIVKQVASVAGGGGGGNPGLAQAGGKDKSKLDEALRLAKRLIKEK
jgi:alanyl-tRNA synthetase